MKISFRDKSILVTGGAAGIGFETARMFAKAGGNVTIIDLNQEKLVSAKKELEKFGTKILALKCDVSKEESVKLVIEKIVEQFGKLDIAYNNVGIQVPVATIDEASGDDFDKCISVNLKGTWNSLKYEIKQMKKQGKGGSIINCSSQCGVMAQSGLGAYTSSKHAIIGLTKVAALENAKNGIRVNAICPGTTDAPMVQKAIKDFPEHMKKLIGAIPIGRIATPEGIGSAVLYLASDYAGFITGEIMNLDGGCTLV